MNPDFLPSVSPIPFTLVIIFGFLVNCIASARLVTPLFQFYTQKRAKFLGLALLPQKALFYCLFTKTISTRRFCSRPAAVALDAIGLDEP